jgi:hypothetical protein
MKPRSAGHLHVRRLTQMKLVALFAAVCWLNVASAGEPLPPYLVGVWATEDSVIENGALYGGTAFYLDNDGEAALVGAPLPAQKCGDHFCAPRFGIRVCVSTVHDTSAIRVVATDGRKTQEIPVAYSPISHTLTMRLKDSERQLLRRAVELPAFLRDELHKAMSACQLAEGK